MSKQTKQDVHDMLDEINATRNGKLTLTLELGQGETYRNNRWTLYAYDRYDRRSVLHGRERRRWVTDFDSLEQANEMIMGHKLARGVYQSSSGHVPVSEIVSHLPDDTDY